MCLWSGLGKINSLYFKCNEEPMKFFKYHGRLVYSCKNVLLGIYFMSGTISDISWSLHLGNLQSSSQMTILGTSRLGSEWRMNE